MHYTPDEKDIVFSKHALERMEQRIITEEMVLHVIKTPYRTYLEDDGDTKFIAKVNGAVVHVVCKPLPDQKKWLVKSTWVRGEDDYGNRVERRQHYQSRRKPLPRAVPTPPSTNANALFLNLFLFIVLIIAVIGFVYLLVR